jgi:hypothetical protein
VRGTNEHMRYLHWMHFAEGTIMLHLVARLYLRRVGDAAKSMQARVKGMIGDELDLVEAELTRPYGGRGVQRGGRPDDVPAGICRIRQARGRPPCLIARLPGCRPGLLTAERWTVVAAVSAHDAAPFPRPSR